MDDDFLIEEIFAHGPPYSEEERLFVGIFGKDVPHWEGIAIPRVEAFRKYLRAVEISEKLFGNSDDFKMTLQKPEPFKDYCGAFVNVQASDKRVACAVFQGSEAMRFLNELLDLVDAIYVDAEILLHTGEPRLSLSWYINNPFLGNPDTDE